MSDDLFETLRKLVRHELRQQRFAELGVVQAVYASDPGNHDADVVLHATQLVLRHVPLMTPRKGIASLPDVGDLVLVQFLGGDINRPVVVGTLYNGDDRPPEHAEGQWVLQLPSGPDAAEDGVRLEIRQDGPGRLHAEREGRQVQAGGAGRRPGGPAGRGRHHADHRRQRRRQGRRRAATCRSRPAAT